MADVIHIVIADDDPHIAKQWMSNYLDFLPDIKVDAVCSIERDVLPTITRFNPQVVLIDMSWRSNDHVGSRLIVQIRDTRPRLAILAYSAHRELLPAAGANYNLLKPFSIEELAEAIRTAHDMNRDAYQPLREELSTNELAVLKLLVKGHTDREIALSQQLSEHTIKDYVSRIIAKMGAKNRTHASAMAIRLGLVR